MINPAHAVAQLCKTALRFILTPVIAVRSVHVEIDGKYEGHIVIYELVKDDSALSIASLKVAGVKIKFILNFYLIII